MPDYQQPPEQWFAQRLAALAQDVAALKKQSTQYVIDNTGVCQAIIGNLTHDHEGKSTGLTGWGLASYKTGSWVKL
jgi:hypothetical protein